MPIFNALGKPKIQFQINIINLFGVGIILFLLTRIYGIFGAALATLLISAIISAISILEIKKILPIKIVEFFKPLIVPTIAAIIPLTIGRYLIEQLHLYDKLEFIGLVSILGIIYVILVALAGKILKSGPYNTLKLVFSEVMKKII